jgi:hypothetical protein
MRDLVPPRDLFALGPSTTQSCARQMFTYSPPRSSHGWRFLPARKRSPSSTKYQRYGRPKAWNGVESCGPKWVPAREGLSGICAYLSSRSREITKLCTNILHPRSDAEKASPITQKSVYEEGRSREPCGERNCQSPAVERRSPSIRGRRSSIRWCYGQLSRHRCSAWPDRVQVR